MRSESARKARIEELASQIASLSTELENLLLEDQVSNNNTPIRVREVRRSAVGLRTNHQIEEIGIGDRILIVNNYRGHRGQTGTVIEVEPDGGFIHFQQDHPRIRSKRLPHNLRKIA